MNIILSKQSEKMLKKTDKNTEHKIWKYIDRIPKGLGISKLHLSHGGSFDRDLYRVKLEHYRIIFEKKENGDIYIEKILAKTDAKFRRTGCYF